VSAATLREARFRGIGGDRGVKCSLVYAAPLGRIYPHLLARRRFSIRNGDRARQPSFRPISEWTIRSEAHETFPRNAIRGHSTRSPLSAKCGGNW
jgi:hypothetical protein